MMNPTANIESATATNAGFKQTEVGWIPVDWLVIRLGEFSSITKLAGFEYSKHFNSYKDGGSIIVLRGTNITNNKLDLTDTRSIPEHTSKMLLRSKLFKGDLVFAYVGTIGPVYLVEEDNRFHLGPNTSKISINKNIDARYIFNYFKSWLINNEIILYTSIGAQPSLSMSKIRKFKIALPPTLAEQTAIATALSDMDALIQAQEELLAKKRALKQGAMQELLTGKRRLVEAASNTFKQTEVGRIPVDWEVRELGEICSLAKNKVNPLSSDAEYKCVELENLSQETGRLLGYQSSIYLKSLKNKFEKGDVLFGKLRPYLKKYLFAEFEGVCSTEIWVIKSAYQICSKWLFYIIQSKWIEESANLSEGTKMPRANWVTVSSTPIPFPQTLQEQTAIATALSHMDTEIEQLEAQLAKYRQLKVGMMQELLTGKKRLV